VVLFHRVPRTSAIQELQAASGPPARQKGITEMSVTRLSTIGSLLILATLTGCNRCESVVTDANRSPDGKFAMLITRTNCGATDPFNTQIILIEALPSRELGKRKTIVFDVDERSPLFHIQAVWKGAKNLFVICKGCNEPDIEIKRTSWKDVTISYDIQP
jgi:hypothetical protein